MAACVMSMSTRDISSARAAACLARAAGVGALAGSHRQLQLIDLTPARSESPRSLGPAYGCSQPQLALRFVRQAACAAEEADRLAVGEALECVIPCHHEVLRGAGVLASLLEVQREHARQLALAVGMLREDGLGGGAVEGAAVLL